MNQPWTLTLTFSGPMGENYSMAVDIEHVQGYQMAKIEPPPPAELGMNTFVGVVDIIKRRVFRTDLFIQEARRLGQQLAERMEDKEGWHGWERQEKLKEWGR